jgi:hypothetical protein
MLSEVLKFYRFFSFYSIPRPSPQFLRLCKFFVEKKQFKYDCFHDVYIDNNHSQILSIYTDIHWVAEFKHDSSECSKEIPPWLKKEIEDSCSK